MHHYRGLVPCLMAERKHNPGLTEMSLDFVVRGTGKVSAVKVNGQKGGVRQLRPLAHADVPQVQRQQDDRQLVDVDALSRGPAAPASPRFPFATSLLRASAPAPAAPRLDAFVSTPHVAS